MLEPAATVIRMCGGASAVAKLTKRDVSRVHRWTHGKSRGGTGGRIPTDVQQDLLEAANDAGINLKPEHFFLPAKPKARRQ